MYLIDPQVGRQSVSVAVLGPAYVEPHGLTGWSLKPIQFQDDISQNPLLAALLSREFFALDVREAFAPNVAAFSGRIADTAELTTKICLDKTTLYRNRDKPADGIFLKPEQAFVMSAAGCAIILASAGDHFIAAHAGRDSLIEREAVLGRATRGHISIVDAIIEEFRKRDMSERNIEMVMMFAIPAKTFEHRFDHPLHGAYNQALNMFVWDRWPDCLAHNGNSMFLDLERLFVEQARLAGVRRVRAEHSLADFPRLAHTRDGNNPERRNLIIVKRDA